MWETVERYGNSINGHSGNGILYNKSNKSNKYNSLNEKSSRYIMSTSIVVTTQRARELESQRERVE
jgi:hypothetical protein